MIPHAPFIATCIPAVVGVFIYAFRRSLKKKMGWIGTAAIFTSVLLILSLSPALIESQQTGKGQLLFTYTWIEPIKVDFGFLIDMVSLPIGLTVAFISAVSCLYSIKYMAGEQDQSRYYALLLFFATGMLGVIFSEDLIQFYLFWELMLIPSYFLIAFWGESEKRLEIGFKYFIFTHAGALSMLLGFLTIYVYTGTFELVKLPLKASAIPPSMSTVIFALLLIGFFVKSAIFPLHVWLPDAHSEAPTPISAMLSGAMVKCGAYGMIRILFSTFGQGMVQSSDYLAIFGIISMIYGGVVALAQTDIKRLLAFSSISQVGYIVFGLGSTSVLGFKGSLLHILSHAVCKSLLFMCAGAVVRQTGTRDIRKLGGLIGKMPITGVACFLGAFSLIGIPPLNGFWSEWMILAGGFASGKVLITLVGVAGTVITTGYYLRFLWKVFLGPTPKKLRDAKEAPLLLHIPIVMLAATSVILGLFPGLMLEFVAPAAEYLSSLVGI
ncbi:MAG: NADH-quinone oxidoreductase subunit L [Candidatus Bathyarchaeota archaeon]|nr:NADH-quinone oxidoreductase subunit L [Candidatus Bathyarchaeota archaeon]